MGRLEPRPDSARLLTQALADPSETVRRAAARSFGELAGTPDIWQPIIPLLKSPDPLRRRTAAQALMQLDLTEVSVSLSKAAEDPDPYVRQGTLAALGESGTVEAVALLRHSLLYDSAPGVRAEAAYRLGKIGTEVLVGELKQVATTDRDQAVREWARWASEELTRLPGSG
jgi:HEAT repeat protein